MICRNFKGVIFYGLDISTGVLNKFPPHFNETRKKVLLTHLFNRIYLENFGEEYEKYEEPTKVNYSSFWNLLNENDNLINIHWLILLQMFYIIIFNAIVFSVYITFAFKISLL